MDRVGDLIAGVYPGQQVRDDLIEIRFGGIRRSAIGIKPADGHGTHIASLSGNIIKIGTVAFSIWIGRSGQRIGGGRHDDTGHTGSHVTVTDSRISDILQRERIHDQIDRKSVIRDRRVRSRGGCWRGCWGLLLFTGTKNSDA